MRGGRCLLRGCDVVADFGGFFPLDLTALCYDGGDRQHTHNYEESTHH